MTASEYQQKRARYLGGIKRASATLRQTPATQESVREALQNQIGFYRRSLANLEATYQAERGTLDRLNINA